MVAVEIRANPFQWPQDWSSSQRLAHLEISVKSKKIRFDTIPAFTNASRIRQIALKNYMPIESKLPNWLFDARLKDLREIQFGCNKFYGNFSDLKFSNMSPLVILQVL